MTIELVSLTQVFGARKRMPGQTVKCLAQYSKARREIGLSPCLSLEALQTLLDTPQLGVLAYLLPSNQLIGMLHVQRVNTWPRLTVEYTSYGINQSLLHSHPTFVGQVRQAMCLALLRQVERDWFWTTDQCGRQPFVLEVLNAESPQPLIIIEHLDDWSFQELLEDVRARGM